MTTETAPLPEYPDKLFYRINEVSQVTGIKPYVLRYWETEFPQLRPSKDSGDQRRYRTRDIDLIFEIKRLLYEEKFTIAGARKHLQTESRSTRTAARVVRTRPLKNARRFQRLRRRLVELRRDIASLYEFI